MYLQQELSKENLEKRNLFSYWHFESHVRKERDPDPESDLLFSGSDPWIRILIKTSRIRNTGQIRYLCYITFKIRNSGFPDLNPYFFFLLWAFFFTHFLT